jgi:hypothetical protein
MHCAAHSAHSNLVVPFRLGVIYFQIITLTSQLLLYTHFTPFPLHLGCSIVHLRKRFASGLDLASLKEHRGRYTALPSIWTPVFKHLRAIAGFIVGDLQVDVTVPVEDLRPKPTYVQITSAAARNIRLCAKLFDNWMTRLDKCVAKRFSQPRVPSNGNNGFTGSVPRSQMNESKS